MSVGTAGEILGVGYEKIIRAVDAGQIEIVKETKAGRYIDLENINKKVISMMQMPFLFRKIIEERQEKQEPEKQNEDKPTKFNFYCKRAGVKINICRMSNCDLFPSCSQKLG